MSNCDIHGWILNSMSNLSKLVYLDLSFNNLAGPIPSLSMSRSLTQIYLSCNGLTSEITAIRWEYLKKLKSAQLTEQLTRGQDYIIPVCTSINSEDRNSTTTNFLVNFMDLQISCLFNWTNLNWVATTWKVQYHYPCLHFLQTCSWAPWIRTTLSLILIYPTTTCPLITWVLVLW